MVDNILLFNASTWIVPLLTAIIVHEVAHGWVAEKFGDGTARQMGRITLNPIKHIHPVGTIALPLLLFLIRAPFLFGFARPVPVRFDQLQPLRLGTMAVAMAGPASNLLMALTIAPLFMFLDTTATSQLPSLSLWLTMNAANFLLINVVLMWFNLLPIPPLDGSRLWIALLPPHLQTRIYRIEPLLLFVLLIALFLSTKATEINLIHILILQPVETIVGWLVPH